MRFQASIRRRKAHFEVGPACRRRNKIEILKKLSDFNEFLGSLGLGLSSKTPILIEKKGGLSRDNADFKIKISNTQDETPHSQSESYVLKTLNAVESTYISERNYKKLRTDLELQETLPSLYKLKSMKTNFQHFFELDNNEFGYFLKYPLKKVEFVLKKIFEHNPKVFENDTIYIKLTGDGQVLTNAKVEVNNITFTVINDTKRCKTSVGNYILGK